MIGEEWIDVTEELLACQPKLKLLDLIKDDNLTLEECMQSQQINDDKMDPKYDISSQSTITYFLENKLIRLPHQLSPLEIATIMANVFQLEAAVLKGNSLHSSIYTFSYLYDQSIYKDSLIFKALIDSIFSLGSHIYSLLKESCSVKDDDSNISSISYIKNPKTHDEVIDLILQAQKMAETEAKKKQDKDSWQFIAAYFRLRRMLHNLAKTTGKCYIHEKSKKIIDELNSVKKKLKSVRQTEFNPQKKIDKIFYDSLSKVLRSHFGPRESQKYTFSQSLDEVSNLIDQLELFFPLSSKVSEYKNKIQILESKPYNVWSKSYIKVSIFFKDDYIFGTLKTEQAIIDDINDWIPVKDNIKNSQKFNKIIKYGAQVISETLYRLLGNNMRWQWQCSKVYEDFNVMVHLSSQLDLEITHPHRQLYISSWFYYYGLNLMIKQMLVGFEIKLYHPNEAKPVFYVLNNLLGVFQKNSFIHLRKIDKAFLFNFKENNFNKKLKKKMNENSKRIFADIIFKQALHMYARSLFRITCLLHHRKLIANPFEQSEETRVNNRFRIFKSIMFVKPIVYEQYQAAVQDVCKNEMELIPAIMEDLKEMKNDLQLFVNQFDDHEVFHNQRNQADLLIKSSIKASLAIMTLKMNGNKKFEFDFSGNFPSINMN